MTAQALTLACVELAIKAGLAIKHQAQSLDIQHKQDNSPVTNADMASEKIILEGLSSIQGIQFPVLSEESHEAFQYTASKYWCVDPLDGTKDFIHKTGDYTVNIALMEKGKPILGVVHAPEINTTYFADESGAWKRVGEQTKPIQVGALDASQLTVLVSRFHSNQDLVDSLKSMPEVSLLARGSAVKVCVIADGKADIYPRTTPCHDWDIAAAHCILSAAGGEILDFKLEPLTYNQAQPWLLTGFVAVNNKNYDWKRFTDRIPT
jgi:3'(2'), 5'-bisphosphate nucleotidase